MPNARPVHELVVPHVRAHLVDGHAVVDVDDDAELVDFVEDELLERGELACEYMLVLKASKQRRLVFPESVALQSAFEALSAISSDELVRVYRINNPPA